MWRGRWERSSDGVACEEEEKEVGGDREEGSDEVGVEKEGGARCGCAA